MVYHQMKKPHQEEKNGFTVDNRDHHLNVCDQLLILVHHIHLIVWHQKNRLFRPARLTVYYQTDMVEKSDHIRLSVYHEMCIMHGNGNS